MTDPIPVEFPSASNYPDKLFNVAWTRTVSSAIVNQARASFARIRFNSGVTTDPSGIFGLTGNSLVGIPSKAQSVAGFSYQSFSGLTNTTIGQVSNMGANPTPEIFIDNVFEYSDNLTWQRGKHLFKFGAELTRYQQNSFYPGNDGELGAFTYNGAYTSNPFVANGSGGGYSFADFLLQRSSDVTIGDSSGGRKGQRQWRSAFFGQDDFKIMPNLTLNLGLRYEFDQPIFEVHNKTANINLDTGAVEYAGSIPDGNFYSNATTCSNRACYDPTYTNFMPRVGFAYQVQPRIVVRGGYGITTYLEGTGANLRLIQNPPFHSDYEEQGTSPTATTSGYSSGVYFDTSAGFPTGAVAPTTFYAWKKHLQPAVIQEFSITTEYQVLANSSISVGYVGELGHHLTDPQFGNQLSSPTATAPYADIVGQGGVVKITATDSAMNYQALQAIYRQRLTAGLEFTANYTYSKSLTDDIGYYGVSNIAQQYYQQNAYDLHSEWGPSGEDVRHALSATGTYAIPFGRGKTYGSNVNYLVDEVLGGWKLSGSGILYTGFPVTITSNANYSSLVKAYGGAARPNEYRTPKIRNHSIANWFGNDPGLTDKCGPGANDGICDFAQQPDDAFGSERPGSLRAPGFQNIDAAIEKSFPVFHEQHVNFRADAFNVGNIVSYGNPDNGLTDTGFGQITSTRSTERHLQLELKYAF